ncbi:MAG: arsenate reductase ArsC [Alphaproteobacteria bacterium]|nr:arsenate reductase ArsC [Alphaproteobacteria bacterium]MBF0324594.1 arsenate reductase ArsC [Alphaproteobacteria bacterium]
MAADLPGAVLFCCTFNSVRSPMAEGIMKRLHGKRIFIDSVGVKHGELDPFVVAVMDEIGIDVSRHKPRTFDDLEDSSFDVVVSLSPEAQHKAVDLVRHFACEVEYWPTFDPTAVEGSRETRLDAYRQVRDELWRHIRDRFPPVGMSRE